MRSIKDIFRSHAEFDAQGRHVNGTDKQSNHNYGDAYESLFRTANYNENLCSYPLGSDRRFCSKCGSDTSHKVDCPEFKWVSTRDKVKLMMGVGVADGACLRAWREVFPNATIVGLDIHHSDQANGDRIEFHLGDATYQHNCARVAAGRQFDLIIDDATHKLSDILKTMLFLWPHVRPGGLYVVEEFDGVLGLRANIAEMWPHSQIVETVGPSGGVEPLVVLRKPL